MDTWTSFTIMANDTEIRLDLLEHGGDTAGWIVRRSCGVHLAWLRPPDSDASAFDLERDGLFVGVASSAADARQLILDRLGISTLPRQPRAAERVTL